MATLLLPGMDGTGQLFASFASAVEPTLDPRVVRYPPDRPLSYDELLDEIDVPSGPFAILAESFSGPLGIRLARRHSDRVRALVLVASFARTPSAFARWLARLGGAPLFRVRPPALVLRLGLLGMDAPAHEVASLRAAIGSVAPRVLAERVKEIARVDARDAFSRVDVPTLYVAGSRDRLVGRRTVSELKRLRPEMATAVLDAPHLVLQRRPAEAARLISEFLGMPDRGCFEP